MSRALLHSTLLGEHAVWNLLSHAFLETNFILVRVLDLHFFGLATRRLCTGSRDAAGNPVLLGDR